MFWAGSIAFRYTIALFLNTILILLLKFAIDRCTANMGYHIFVSDSPLSPVVCQPIGRWVSSARAIESMQNGGSYSAFNQPSQHWLVAMITPGNSISNSFGIDTFPTTLTDSRTNRRVCKLLLYWLLPPFIVALLAETILSFRQN